MRALAEHSFLSLWSYCGIFRDQDTRAGRCEGKELCDLLVVFGDDVLIFSDKACEFPDSGNEGLDWQRWFRRAIDKSAQQIWGAERWIRKYPNRIFVDRSCRQPFPIDLPDMSRARVHRVVVAHNSTLRSRRAFRGGSGSLMLVPALMGDDHYRVDTVGRSPLFTIGQLNPRNGFVHVLDDVTLVVLLRQLDTIRDLTAYLSKKEAFVLSGKLVSAAGEEEMLAHFLRYVDANGDHAFMVPPDIDCIALDEGLWARFCHSPQRHRQVDANQVSYVWDRLIEAFSANVLGGTLAVGADRAIADHEQALRLMAAEPRTRRRFLARSLLEVLGRDGGGVRVIASSERERSPCYVFCAFPRPPGVDASDATYRERRGLLLEAYCRVAKLRDPQATQIVGIATESGDGDERSEDLLYADVSGWTDEDERIAMDLRSQLGLPETIELFRNVEKEYPDASP